MKDPSGLIRTWLYGVLYTKVSYGGSVVPVYSFVPKDAAMPYILIAEQTGDPEGGTKDQWMNKHNVTIEIYVSSKGNDASYVPLNTISDSVVQLVRTRTAVTIAGFTVVSVTVQGMVTYSFVGESDIILYKSINITLELVET